MALDPRVLFRESLHLLFAQSPSKPNIQFSGEIIIEFGKQFDVEEEDGCGGEFGGYDVEEDLGAVVAIGFGGALFGIQGLEAEFEEDGAVPEEDGFFTFMVVSSVLLCVCREGGTYLFAKDPMRTHQHRSHRHPQLPLLLSVLCPQTP